MADLGTVGLGTGLLTPGDESTTVEPSAPALGPIPIMLLGPIYFALASGSPEHRAEQVMKAVQTLLTGLTTSGSRVDRGRDEDIDASLTPALRLAVDDDGIMEPWAHQLLDSDLLVTVFAHAHDSAENIEQILHRMRKEVNFALANQSQLGLDFVHSIVEIGAKKPILSGDARKPVGRMELNYAVKYRRLRTDPSIGSLP